MSNLKELKEQRNELLNQMDGITSAITKEGNGKESRNLTSDEAERFENLVAQVATIDSEIEELRTLKGQKVVEERSMAKETNLQEQRSAMNAYIKNDIAEVRRLNEKAAAEERAQYVNTQNDGSVLIPENISDEILRKMEEASPV